MAVVLVIIALVIGGIFVGASMRDASAVRSVITDVTMYRDAIKTFQETYNGLPGDISWQAAPFASPNSATLSTGNGDGVITWSTAASGESFQAWLHLQGAKMVKGNYSGTATSNASSIDVNVPGSSVSNKSGFTFYNIDNVAGGGNDASQFYPTPPSPMPMSLTGNYLAFGATATNSYTSGGILLQEHAYNIDTKIDDGTPNTGAVLGTPANPDPGRCITIVSIPSNTVSYNVTATPAKGCNLYFRL